MMTKTRGMRFSFHNGVSLAQWKQFISLGDSTTQLAWLIEQNLQFYERQHDLNVVWQEVSTLWWTEEQYQSFKTALDRLPGDATDADLPERPKRRILVSFSVFDPRKNALRIWKNRTLQNYLKRRDLYHVYELIMVYCKGFNLTDKAKKKGKKDSDPLVQRAYKKMLWQWRALFAKPRYDCKLSILTSTHLSLFVPDFFIMPKYEKIDPEDFPDGIQEMRDRPFGIMYSNESMVKLHNWKIGDHIRIVSYLDRVQPYVEIRVVHPVPTLFTKYTPEDLARVSELVPQKMDQSDIESGSRMRDTRGSASASASPPSLGTSLGAMSATIIGLPMDNDED
jgi:hypothetical protein